MAFRYKVTKTVQVRQFEPLTVEAEYSTDKALSLEGWSKAASRVEKFVKARLLEQLKEYKAIAAGKTTSYEEADPWDSVK